MEGNPQNRIQEVSADEIGRQIQAVAIYCGNSPTGSNTTKGDNSHVHQLLGSKSRDGERDSFYREEKIRSPAKGQLEEASPAITRMLGDFMQHQAEQPRSQSGSHFLKVQYTCCDSELDLKWRGKN